MINVNYKFEVIGKLEYIKLLLTKEDYRDLKIIEYEDNQEITINVDLKAQTCEIDGWAMTFTDSLNEWILDDIKEDFFEEELSC